MNRWLPVVAMLLCMGCTYAGNDDTRVPKQWADVLSAAEGGQVRLYMAGDNPRLNEWIDTRVGHDVRRLYGIKLVRVPLGEATILARLSKERSVGGHAGNMDLLVLPAADFQRARVEGMLFGPFAEKLPNFIRYVNKPLAAQAAGRPVHGFGVPFARRQLSFVYDANVLEEPPRSMLDLLKWAMDHPGRFTYPVVNDAAGCGFLQQAVVSMASMQDKGIAAGEGNPSGAETRAWELLDNLRPYLWQAGQTHPADQEALLALFHQGEIHMAVTYGGWRPAPVAWDTPGPDPVAYGLEEGCVYSMDYLAIPASAPDKSAAMVVANHLLSPGAQLERFRLEGNMMYPAIDLNTVDKQVWGAFAMADRGGGFLSLEILDRPALGEPEPAVSRRLRSEWVTRFSQ